MSHRSPQRTYNSRTIELWFDRLNRNWEEGFSDEELRWGRQYYRTGEVRSTELLESSAIVHFKRGKEPLYVIVDWEDEQLSFRESHPEVAPGNALAVAGMYELEELNLIGTQVGDQGMELIKQLPTLKVLHLGRTPISDTGLQKLHSLKSLSHIYLNQTKVTNKGIAKLKEALPNVKVVY